jgi:hypothetical protein
MTAPIAYRLSTGELQKAWVSEGAGHVFCVFWIDAWALSRLSTISVSLYAK